MVVAETLVGLQLVQQSCKAIKMAINTTKDVSEIAGLIDNVFKGQEQVKKKAHPIASKWGGLVKGVTSDSFLQMAIQETVEEKICQEQIDKISLLLNQRFGKDTWIEIQLMRTQKQKEHEELVEKRKKMSKKRWNKIFNVMGAILAIGASVGAIMALVGIINRALASNNIRTWCNRNGSTIRIRGEKFKKRFRQPHKRT
jgi:membrane carboxypeptidase/penicillin-binding protein